MPGCGYLYFEFLKIIISALCAYVRVYVFTRVCVCKYRHTCATVHLWRTEGDFGSQFCLPTMGSEDRTQADRFGGKGLLLPAEPHHQPKTVIVLLLLISNFVISVI